MTSRREKIHKELKDILSSWRMCVVSPGAQNYVETTRRSLGEASEKHLQANFPINTRNQNVHSQIGVAVVTLLSSNSLLVRILLPVC